MLDCSEASFVSLGERSKASRSAGPAPLRPPQPRLAVIRGERQLLPGEPHASRTSRASGSMPMPVRICVESKLVLLAVEVLAFVGLVEVPQVVLHPPTPCGFHGRLHAILALPAAALGTEDLLQLWLEGRLFRALKAQHVGATLSVLAQGGRAVLVRAPVVLVARGDLPARVEEGAHASAGHLLAVAAHIPALAHLRTKQV
eukprot:CAMPEP_0171126096 /NCGR_PEP_ID=MMETSP0766_2-20121228/112614_1 /TAXON_ID=439317 /ORGANISM="Gambierdiscus australes, Strain CAWD 149" /LENGTH=200 /DNA_ID=CAMNT_0011589109 /DNA_START=84 /DNA_END=685 /DNA_ORIENTATION=+